MAKFYGVEMVAWDAQAALPDDIHGANQSPAKLQELSDKFVEAHRRGGRLLVQLPLAEPGKSLLVFEFGVEIADDGSIVR